MRSIAFRPVCSLPRNHHGQLEVAGFGLPVRLYPLPLVYRAEGQGGFAGGELVGGDCIGFGCLDCRLDHDGLGGPLELGLEAQLVAGAVNPGRKDTAGARREGVRRGHAALVEAIADGDARLVVLAAAPAQNPASIKVAAASPAWVETTVQLPSSKSMGSMVVSIFELATGVEEAREMLTSRGASDSPTTGGARPSSTSINFPGTSNLGQEWTDPLINQLTKLI